MKFTASKSALLAICQYPFRDDVNAPEAPDDPYTRVGTVFGARLAAHVESKADPGNGELPPEEAVRIDKLVAIGRPWLEEQRAGMKAPRCEVKYAWSPSNDAARQLPPSDKLRDYSDAKDDEKCGSTDLEYVENDVVTVEDFKTGYTAIEQYIPQIRTLGLMVARARGVRRIRTRLTKFHDDAPPDTLERVLDGFALDGIAEDLRNRLAAAKDAEPIPGPHCTEMFCPARLVCPAVKTMVGELVPETALTAKLPKFSHTFISHDHDAQMLELLRIVAKSAEDLKELIKKRTPKGGVALSDGRYFRENFSPVTKFSEESLIAKVKELAEKAKLDPEAVDQELERCKFTFQKSSGLKAVKPKLPPKSKKSEEAA